MFRDDKQLLVIYCLQLLLVLVSYPVPETTHGVVQKNYFRHFLGRLHRPQDFQFLVDGMTRILNQQVRSIINLGLLICADASEHVVPPGKPEILYSLGLLN